MNNQESRYNPFKDASFWVAFVLGGGVLIPYLIYKGMLFEPPVLLMIVFLIGWTGWIIFKKGKKWSLVVGFFVGLILSLIAFYPINKIEESRGRVEMIEEKTFCYKS